MFEGEDIPFLYFCPGEEEQVEDVFDLLMDEREDVQSEGQPLDLHPTLFIYFSPNRIMKWTPRWAFIMLQ